MPDSRGRLNLAAPQVTVSMTSWMSGMTLIIMASQGLEPTSAIPWEHSTSREVVCKPSWSEMPRINTYYRRPAHRSQGRSLNWATCIYMTASASVRRKASFSGTHCREYTTLPRSSPAHQRSLPSNG